MTTPVGLDISGWTRQATTPVLDGNNPTNVRSGSGTGHDLTIDYFVAPYADVTGATSDEDVTNGTAYASATTAGSPCTLFEASENCAAGDMIQTAAGAYVVTETGVPQDPAFNPITSGTSLNPIVFVAEYPASQNSNTVLYSQLKRVGAIATDPCAIFGPSDNGAGKDYITFDGFYVDYDQDGHPGSRGICYVNDSDNVTIRRCKFKRADLGTADDGDNFNCIHVNRADNLTLDNNVFDNGYDSNGSHNKAAVTLYEVNGITLTHNEFLNVTTGLYIKGDFANTGNDGLVKFNKFVDCRHPMLTFYGPVAASGDMEITQNLVYYTQALTGLDFSFEMQASTVANTQDFKVHHNTFIVAGDSVLGGYYINNSTAMAAFNGSDFRDNIVACISSGLSAPLVDAGGNTSMSPFNQFDYNWYYNNGSNLRFNFNSTGYTSATALADWVTNASVDANSSAGDPNFVDSANYDFTITSGSTRTASSTGGPVGCYITNSEEIGLEASPSY